MNEPCRVASPTVALGIQDVALASLASVYADGGVGKKFSNESSKRPRPLRHLLLCEQSGGERREIQNGFLTLPRQFRLSVKPRGTAGGPCPCFFTADSLTCARTLTKVFRGVNDGARVCPFDRQWAGRCCFGYRNKDTGWSGNREVDWEVMHGSAARSFQLHYERVAAPIA